MKYLIKFDRLFAWILFASMFLFFISGYGMTKGIITNSLAIQIHNKILPPIAIAAFTIHAWYAIHLAFKRWQIWNVFTKIFLTLFFLGFVGYFGYLNYFYVEPTVESNSIASTNDSASDDSSTVTTSEPTTKTFTSTELAKYDGKNGQPAYIAVDGKVYDVSSLFINGVHRGCYAGQDLSSEFHDEHSNSLLSGYEIVGDLK